MPKSNAFIDLVLQSYLPKDKKNLPDKLDSEFRAFAIIQIRLFVFVSHDSTSSTICRTTEIFTLPNLCLK
jgi:hypothetical protein